MNIRVLLFAAAKDRAGTDSVDLAIAAPADIASVQAVLLLSCPGLQSIAGSLLWAVNNRYAQRGDLVTDGDTVACFPPVSGG